MELTTSQVLNKAADLIEERGWRRGPGMQIDSVGLCLEQAVSAAAGNIIAGSYAYLQAIPCAAGHALIEHLGNNQPYIWNDEPGRTASEVIEVLRATALIEAAREEQDAAWETYAEVVTA